MGGNNNTRLTVTFLHLFFLPFCKFFSCWLTSFSRSVSTRSTVGSRSTSEHVQFWFPYALIRCHVFKYTCTTHARIRTYMYIHTYIHTYIRPITVRCRRFRAFLIHRMYIWSSAWFRSWAHAVHDVRVTYQHCYQRTLCSISSVRRRPTSLPVISSRLSCQHLQLYVRRVPIVSRERSASQSCNQDWSRHLRNQTTFRPIRQIDFYLRPSVLWHCWLGHLTVKPVPDMTYNVFSGKLNHTQSINFRCRRGWN